MREEVRRILNGMTREELIEVWEYVAELIDEKEEETPENQRGHVELKWIPGKGGKLYGPYAYLRWWEDGKHKAKYLGKVVV
ncbi:hypothetical protein [Candidatus Caldatribacterium saccharofermentans]|uniref:hypothetical protein n=1 Tax=Candidatus Caldatribacterium saccharofermentans TaxID=1454753 RepID=UPI003D0899EA